MDRASKSELLRTVEEQKEKITKYQNKLRDLVAAYKGVLKEKEALEKSLQILGSANGNNTPKDGNQITSQDNAESEGSNHSHNNTAEDSVRDEITQLKEQLATLTCSMATLTQEKSKMEANYQAEKKALRQEYEDRESRYEEDLSQLHSSVDELEDQLNTYKGKLREEQHEREKEQHDHSLMLRELQTLMSAERHAKEQLESQIEELKFELEEEKSVPRGLSQESHDKQVKDMQRMIDSLKGELQRHMERDSGPSEELVQTQADNRRLKAEHSEVLGQERDRLQLAQKMLQEVSTHGEQRISSLETKISELSKSVGDYERLRFHDQHTIVKLRERLTQLDLENTALAKATQAKQENEPERNRDADVAELVEKISSLMTQLIEANERTDKPVPMAELLALCEFDERTDLHTQCTQQFETLREEFERYKLRAQSVLKNKHSKDLGGNKEVEELQKQVSDLKERLWQVRSEKDEIEAQARVKEETLSKALVSVQEQQREALASAESEHQLKMTELNVEMKRHRERTIALLAEKDRELEMLRQRSPEYTYRLRNSSSDQDLLEGGASSEAEPSSVVSELLARSSLMGNNPGETTLLHFAQEQARKDVEINSLRKQKHGLETALRELQHNSVLKEERFTDQIDLLKEEIRKNERNKSRENANLEYLKNVVYKYMVCTDYVGRNQMLNAISTILQFSPKERLAVDEHLKSGWFSYGTLPKKT